MSEEMYTMKNVTAIVFNRKTEEYHVNYRCENTTTHNISLPVFTGNMSASGTMNRSRVLSQTTPTIRTQTKTANAIVSSNAARAMGRAFRNAGWLGTVEDTGLELVQNINKSTNRIVAIGNETGVTDWDFTQSTDQEEIAADMQSARGEW